MGLENHPLVDQLDKIDDDNKVEDKELQDFKVEYEKEKVDIKLETFGELKNLLFEIMYKEGIKINEEQKKSINNLIETIESDLYDLSKKEINDDDFINDVKQIYIKQDRDGYTKDKSEKERFGNDVVALNKLLNHSEGKTIGPFFEKIIFEKAKFNKKDFIEYLGFLDFGIGKGVSDLVYQFIKHTNMYGKNEEISKRISFFNELKETDYKNYIGILEEFMDQKYFYETITYLQKYKKGNGLYPKINIGAMETELKPETINLQRGIAKFIQQNNLELPKDEKGREKVLTDYEKRLNEFMDQDDNFDHIFVISALGNISEEHVKFLKNRYGEDKVTVFESEKTNKTPQEIIDEVITKQKEIQIIKKPNIFFTALGHGGGGSVGYYNSEKKHIHFDLKNMKDLANINGITSEIHSCYGGPNLINYDQLKGSTSSVRYNANKTMEGVGKSDDLDVDYLLGLDKPINQIDLELLAGGDKTQRVAFEKENLKTLDENMCSKELFNYLIENHYIKKFYNGKYYTTEQDITDINKPIYQKEIIDKLGEKYQIELGETIKKINNLVVKDVFYGDYNHDGKVTMYEAKIFVALNYHKSEVHTLDKGFWITDNSQTNTGNNLPQTV